MSRIPSDLLKQQARFPHFHRGSWTSSPPFKLEDKEEFAMFVATIFGWHGSIF
jgi:hypothetical protein